MEFRQQVDVIDSVVFLSQILNSFFSVSEHIFLVGLCMSKYTASEVNNIDDLVTKHCSAGKTDTNIYISVSVNLSLSLSLFPVVS